MTRQDELKRLREDERQAIRDAYSTPSQVIALYTKLEGSKPTSIRKNEARFRKHGSLHVYLRTGGFSDYEADVHGDVFAAIKYFIGCDFVGALQWLRADLGLPVDGPVPRISDEERQRREQAAAAAQEEASANQADNIRRAQTLWAQGRHVTDSPGKRYLEDERAIGPQDWQPSFVRWHDAERFLMFPVTDDDGLLYGIQRIAVRPDGQKDLRWLIEGARKAKLSLGLVGRGLVRIPGKNKDAVELQIAEGPETGLAAWSSNGIETWIALGGRVIKPPVGRRVIYLRDDDKRNPKTERKRRQLMREWRNDGLSFVDVNPFERRRGKKQDFNDLLKERGHAAVAARIALFAYEQKPVDLNYVPLDEARNKLDACVKDVIAECERFDAEACDATPVSAIKVTVGGGKSDAALRNIYLRLKAMREAGDNRVFIYLVPYHDLGAKLVERWRNIAGDELTPAIWRGRESKKPDARNEDDKMCERIEDVRKAQKMRVKVGQELCAHCPLQSKCAYIAQRQQDGDIWFMAHPALFSRIPKTIGAKNVAGVIVDETPWQSGIIGGTDIPLTLLDAGAMPVPSGDGPLGGGRLTDNRIRLKIAAETIGQDIKPGESRHITAAALKSVGFDIDTGADGVKMERYREVIDGPWQERVQNRTVGSMMMVWSAVRDLLASGQDASDRLKVELNDDNALVIAVSGRSDISEDWHKPTLLIDASLEPEILRLFWPSVRVVGEFAIDAPFMKVHQVQGRAFSKTMLAPLAGDPISDAAKDLAKYKSRSRRSVRAYVLKMARQNGGRTLVVSNLDIINALALPPHIETAHFNALAGLDDFGDVRTAIIIGRTQPRPHVVEDLAGALTGLVIERLADNEWYPARDAVRFKRTPGGIVPVVGETSGHQDDAAEMIRHRICEGEVEQAIGRARGVNRTAADPLDVYLLSDVALNIPVDTFLDPEDVTAPSPLDLMLGEGGIAFADGTAASAGYPSLWRNPNAAKVAFHRQRSVTLPKEDSSLGNVTLLDTDTTGLTALTFQKAGAGCKPQIAWFDPVSVPDPRPFIEANIGPLAFCEVRPPAAQVEAEPDPDIVPVWDDDDDEDADETVDWPTVEIRLRDGGKTFGELAQRCAVSPFHLSNIRHGRRRLTKKVVAGVKAFLDDTPQTQGRLF